MIITKMKKGVSEVVGVSIAFAIISIAMLYILLSFFSSLTALQQSIPIPTYYVNEKLVLYLIGDNLNMRNIGSIVSHVIYVVAVDQYQNRIVIDIERSSQCSTYPSNTVPPGGSASIVCRNAIPIAVITKNGRVFTLDPQLYALIIERTTAIPIVTVYGGFTLTSTSGLIKFLENPSIMMGGAVNTSKRLTLLVDSSGSISANLNVALVIVGRNPANNKLNILAIGRGKTGDQLNIGGSSINLANVASHRYRLKIENFTGIINLGLGIHACYINKTSMCTLSLNGQADRILLYNSTDRARSGTVGLEPYVFIGDIDGNDNVEMIFVTQDFSYGGGSNVNDRLTIDLSTVYYIDSSITPLRLVFHQVPIDSNKYSSAILSVRMFFWDNSIDDISNNDNRVIVRVGLYDNTTKTFIYSVYLSYYELCRYRHVTPFSISYITKDFTIYIPNTGRRYYVAIEILDPFHLEGNRNDADLIIGLEYIGIALSNR
ncbi:MAG: hypothetical protein QW775_02150 [Ignisphaera sp.]|uniref:Uncharacterized protein n=1 Tax=Ignisphaera aggregans TaxID=334771 RepID=A0A7C4NJQ9_9CREN